MSADVVLVPPVPPSVAGGGSYGPMPNEAVVHVYLQAMRAQRRSERTVQRHEWLLGRLAEYLAPTLLLEARYPHLLAWQASHARLNTGTLAGYVSSIRTFYRWCHRPMRLLVESPAEDLVVPKVPAHQPRPVPEPHLQIAVALTPDPQMRAWLYLGAYAGLRCCEMAWMQRDWIVEGELPRLHVLGKGGVERLVYIGPQLLELLRPFMHRTGYLFLRPDGLPHSPHSVSERVSRHFRAIGMGYTAHQLRHRFGTRALELTQNLRVVQEQMGHASPATTQVYTLVSRQETIDLAKALDVEVRDSRRK